MAPAVKMVALPALELSKNPKKVVSKASMNALPAVELLEKIVTPVAEKFKMWALPAVDLFKN
jgi:hypothetical protein